MEDLKFGTKWHDLLQRRQEVVGKEATSVVAKTPENWRGQDCGVTIEGSTSSEEEPVWVYRAMCCERQKQSNGSQKIVSESWVQDTELQDSTYTVECCFFAWVYGCVLVLPI